MTTGNEYKHMPSLHAVQVKVPVLVTATELPIYACQREYVCFFKFSLLCGKPKNCQAHMSREKNLPKVKKLSTQKLGNAALIFFTGT